MKLYRPKLILFSISLVLAIYLLMPTLQVLAQDNPSSQLDQKAAPLSSAEVDSHLADMSNEQFRQAYAQKLIQDAKSGLP